MSEQTTSGIGATNVHRAHRVLNSKGEPAAPWWGCTGCDWRPSYPAKVHGNAYDQFVRHLYELVPKRGDSIDAEGPRG